MWFHDFLDVLYLPPPSQELTQVLTKMDGKKKGRMTFHKLSNNTPQEEQTDFLCSGVSFSNSPTIFLFRNNRNHVPVTQDNSENYLKVSIYLHYNCFKLVAHQLQSSPSLKSVNVYHPKRSANISLLI